MLSVRGLISAVCLLVGIGGFALGVMAYEHSLQSNSAIHEIEALVAFVVGVCGIGFAGTIGALDAMIHARKPPPTPKQ